MNIICLLSSILISISGTDSSSQNEIYYDLNTPDTAHSQKKTNHSDTSQLPPIEKEPVLLKFVKAVYPSELSKKGIEGVVAVDLLVNENGTIDSAAVVRGLHPQLDSAVLVAVKQFVFSPAIAGGKPVPVILTYEYKITLEDVIDTLKEYINFSGQLLERGTRVPVQDAQIMLTFTDTTADTALKVPFSVYLKKIGSISGQTLEEKSLVALTDSSGKFTFKSLPVGPVQVKIIAAGYEIFTTTEAIESRQLIDVKYRIMKTSYSDYEIVVYGKSEQKEVAKRTLSLGEIKKLPGFGGDAVKVVQALPGVARPLFGSGAVIVRGTPSWDSQFLLDGIKIPQLYHFGGVKSTYISDALESVDLYPGGYGARYGNTIGGVIEIKSRNADQQRYKGFADVNLFDASVFAEGPIDKNGGIIVSARRSYIGNILSAVVDRMDLPVTIVPYYYDYLVRANYNLNKKNTLFLTLFGSKDQMELIAPSVRGGSKEIDDANDRMKQMTQFNMIIAGWDTKLGGSLTNTLRLSMVRGEGLGSIFGFAKWNYDSWEYYLRNELSYPLSSGVEAQAGADIDWIRYFQTTLFPSKDNTILTDRMNVRFGQVSPYLQMQYRPVSNLLITPGLRYDYFNELNYKGSILPEFWDYQNINDRKGPSGEPSLRLSARYELPYKQTIKAAIGTYNQTPQPMGLVTDKSIGNPQLPATKARQIVLGYERQITDLIFTDIQVYHNQQWDIPVMSTTEDLLENPDGPRFLSNGKGRMYGLEFLLRHDQSEHFFGWIAYSLSRSERYDKTDKKYDLYDNDQTHNLQLIASYKFRKEWQLGSRLRFVSGNPYSPVTGSIYDATEFSYSPNYGITNSKRNDPYFQVDLRVDKKFVFKRWMLSSYIELQNVLVFLYKSPEMTIYNYDYTQKTVITYPFLPSLGIRAEF